VVFLCLPNQKSTHAWSCIGGKITTYDRIGTDTRATNSIECNIGIHDAPFQLINDNIQLIRKRQLSDIEVELGFQPTFEGEITKFQGFVLDGLNEFFHDNSITGALHINISLHTDQTY
jgi:hypothetical protein